MDDLLSEKEQLEQMRTWWSEYGKYVIAGVVLGAGFLFGLNYYTASQLKAQQEASLLYEKLANSVVDENLDMAETVTADIVAEHGDSAYAWQARLLLARIYMDKNRDQDAADTLTELLESDAGEEFKHIGRLRLAKVMLYQGKAEEVVSLLEPQSDSNAFAARYAEALGDAYVALGQYEDARGAYQLALGESSQSATVDQSFVQLKLLDLPLATASLAAEDSGDESGDEATDTTGDEVVE